MYIGLRRKLSHVQVSVQLQGKKVNMKSLTFIKGVYLTLKKLNEN